MIKGLNHLTLSVADLDRSFRFYSELLEFRPRAKWARGAYLSAGDLWLCLTLDKETRRSPAGEYTHIAFSVAQQDFLPWAQRLQTHDVAQWKENSSEGDSLYFLDPDGHKLEIHVGDLASRLDAIRQRPYEGLAIF